MPDEPPAVQGLRLASRHCGIKRESTSKDLTLIEIAKGSTIGGVFTQNHFCAAPVTLCREHLSENSESRYLLINSGNANAATGEQGLQAARDCCVAVAGVTGVKPVQVLPFSTGVIAEPMPTAPVIAAVPELVSALHENAWVAAAEGIMTTDTVPKVCSRQVEINGHTVTINGIAKGSGMIKPQMATLLAFVATDAVIEAGLIQSMLERAVAGSFNPITVDGDTSTNDSCMLMATGASGVSIQGSKLFQRALDEVFIELAQAIIRDAEGATKFIEVAVQGAADENDARGIAFTIAESPLVKTALFASDPNWGRLIMAIGRAPVNRIETDRIDLYLGPVRLLHRGLPDPDYSEAAGQAQMSREEIRISVDLNLGGSETRVWTSDLSYDYVRINAEYRS